MITDLSVEWFLLEKSMPPDSSLLLQVITKQGDNFGSIRIAVSSSPLKQIQVLTRQSGRYNKLDRISTLILITNQKFVSVPIKVKWNRILVFQKKIIEIKIEKFCGRLSYILISLELARTILVICHVWNNEQA